MARGSRGRPFGARDAFSSSLSSGTRSLRSPGLLTSLLEPPVIEDDRRLFHFDKQRMAVRVGGNIARVVVHSRPIVARSNNIWSARGIPVGFQVPVGVRFESPLKVWTCIRRKVRRRVIFAKKKAGFGKSQRMPRRNWRSDVVC